MQLRAAIAAVAGLVCLTGCDSMFTLAPDAFDPGNRDQTTFYADGAWCRAQADQSLDTAATLEPGEQREIYNRAFAQCMTQRGYQRHDLKPGNYNL